MSDRKVFVLGLDGATWDLVRGWVDAGELPVMKRLMAEGAWGDLTSVMQPMSAQAWTSFLTGKNIGRHGLVDFLMRKPGSYDLQIVNGSVRDGKSLWGILSDRDYQVGVINVPMTYPPEPVNGFLISGMDAPSYSSDFTWPKELREELLQVVPQYKIEAGGHKNIYGDRANPEEFIDEMLQVAEARFETTRYLMQNRPWDFLMMVFRPIDRAQHWFWRHMDENHPLHQPGDERYGDTILRVHKAIDRWMGELLEGVDDDTTIVVVSDHGFAPLGNEVVYLNTWLRDQGLLQLRSQSGRDNVQQMAVKRVVWPVWSQLKRNVPTGLKRWLKQTFPQTERRVSSMLILSDIDWGQTLAYAMELRANIWINLKGREPQGTVEPGQEYEALRDKIIEKLHEWQDPFTQEKVVERVFKREELFDGPHFEKTPDLLILFRPQRGYGYNLRQGFLSQRTQSIEVLTEKELRDSARPNANHSLSGICLLRGPNIVTEAGLQDAEIKDVAPTILYLMEEPIPDDMDGRVLTEAIAPEYLAANPIETVPAEDTSREPDLVAYDDQEHQTVQDRLRDLGYID